MPIASGGARRDLQGGDDLLLGQSTEITTFAWHGATRENAVRASSTARTDRSAAGDNTADSSKFTFAGIPPRLRDPCVRAASTRMRRISWAAMAKNCARACY